MREVIRRIAVCLFVVAFVFSGAAWAACIDLPAMQATPVAAAHNHHHADAADHGAHHGGGQAEMASDQDPLANHGHSHTVKCCSVVPVASLAPDLSATPATFSGASISFRIAQRDLTGHVVALDPGIPKTIV